MPAEEIWRRSVTAAIGAEIVAERANLNPHLAYTVGLLHGVGLIAVDRWAKTQDHFPIIASQGFPKETTANEIAVIGFNNASVAGALMHSWGFPENLVEPIRFQYDARATSMKNHPMACLLSVAKWLRDAAHLQPGQAAPAAPDRWALQLLRLTADDLGRLALVTRSTYDRVMQIFDDTQAPAGLARVDAGQR
jgi:HD-like signal output (HDOD) protein